MYLQGRSIERKRCLSLLVGSKDNKRLEKRERVSSLLNRCLVLAMFSRCRETTQTHAHARYNYVVVLCVE